MHLKRKQQVYVKNKVYGDHFLLLTHIPTMEINYKPQQEGVTCLNFMYRCSTGTAILNDRLKNAQKVH